MSTLSPDADVAATQAELDTATLRNRLLKDLIEQI
jgi:hypothetical protein